MKLFVVALLCGLSACAFATESEAETKHAQADATSAADAKPKSSAADQITAHTFPVEAKEPTKVAQAKHDARLISAAAIIQRSNILQKTKEERVALRRLASVQRNLLLNENEAAYNDEVDKLRTQLDEHLAGVITHKAALRAHRKQVRTLKRKMRRIRRNFRRQQRFLRKRGRNIAIIQERIAKNEEAQAQREGGKPAVASAESAEADEE